MEHPLVKDLQWLMIMYDMSSASGTDVGNLPLVLFMLLWEAQFWMAVLSPFFAAYLPIYALTMSDEATALNVDITANG